MKNLRVLVLVVAAVGWTAYRNGTPVPVIPTPQVVPHASIASAAAGMSREDRQAMAEAYRMLSRSVAANPQDEPVFATTADVRRGHRAAMLCIWRGLLDNQPGSVPGLKDAIEAAMVEGVGSSDVPLNPTLQKQAADTFAAIADSIQ